MTIHCSRPWQSEPSICTFHQTAMCSWMDANCSYDLISSIYPKFQLPSSSFRQLDKLKLAAKTGEGPLFHSAFAFYELVMLQLGFRPGHSVTKGVNQGWTLPIPPQSLGDSRSRTILWLGANNILNLEGTRKASFRYQTEKIKAKKYKHVCCLRQAESHQKGAPHPWLHSRCNTSERLPQSK